MIIGEYSPRRSRGEYSSIITEPEANNCFSQEPIWSLQLYCVRATAFSQVRLFLD